MRATIWFPIIALALLVLLYFVFRFGDKRCGRSSQEVKKLSSKAVSVRSWTITTGSTLRGRLTDGGSRKGVKSTGEESPKTSQTIFVIRVDLEEDTEK